MKKIRCLLVDDEPLAISLLQKHVGQLDFLEVTGTCPNALKALEVLKNKNVDLMFLDIRMPAISGIDFLKTLRYPPKVIITTAYREYALEGYDLDIVDYLLKPITFDRFFKAIERYLRQDKQSEIVPAAPGAGEPSGISIKSGYRTVRISTDDILYIESLKDYIKIITTDDTILTKCRIGDMENELSPKGFLRIHRSFIVNLKQVSAFTMSDVEIGKTELPIGDTYKELVTKRLKG
ncbi:LytTR family DNA-binding domain-containing protein [Mucilaginibacter sp. BJC16-A38]|uniref:LytR/AlgR family response regulator transcription factor n=1 Tax=Mucilaginibacter phenanthrenivorans TaxID=1234842 RepID=UPI00215854E4|nr:LytTR family DNA-binding domain-containing protein [Mucilaginibacter phenanthrenivorans]MCR8561194.1 LytTR family DNA-binding domain-containing protein [Mucilaginibacter phenanthrenivorans]